MVIELGEQRCLGEQMTNEVKIRKKVLEDTVKKMELNLNLGITRRNGKEFYVGIVSDPSYRPGRKLPRFTT